MIPIIDSYNVLREGGSAMTKPGNGPEGKHGNIESKVSHSHGREEFSKQGDEGV